MEGARPAVAEELGGREGALRTANEGLAGRRATPRGRAARTLGRGGGAVEPLALLGAVRVPGQEPSPAPPACPVRCSLSHAGRGRLALGLGAVGPSFLTLPAKVLGDCPGVACRADTIRHGVLCRQHGWVCPNASTPNLRGLVAPSPGAARGALSSVGTRGWSCSQGDQAVPGPPHICTWWKQNCTRFAGRPETRNERLGRGLHFLSEVPRPPFPVPGRLEPGLAGAARPPQAVAAPRRARRGGRWESAGAGRDAVILGALPFRRLGQSSPEHSRTPQCVSFPPSLRGPPN